MAPAGFPIGPYPTFGELHSAIQKYTQNTAVAKRSERPELVYRGQKVAR